MDYNEEQWTNAYPKIPYPGSENSIQFKVTLKLDGHWAVYEE
jgi:hypothetical protein